MEEAQFTQTATAFSLSCGVAIDVKASAATIWDILTNAEEFPRWNSTVAGIEGKIRDGAKITIRVPGTDRTFSPRVSLEAPGQRMVWIGGFSPLFKGVRTFELTPGNSGSTRFVMNERFSGLMIPMIKSKLPDFAPIFRRYANDLKTEAERSGQP